MSMCSCPECEKPIPARTIFFTTLSLWVVCPGCRTSLIRARLGKVQALFAVTLLLALFLPAARWLVEGEAPVGTRILLFLVGLVAFGLVVGVPMTLVTLRYGRYVVRRPGDWSMTVLIVLVVCGPILESVLERTNENLSLWERSLVLAGLVGVVLLALEGWRAWRRRPTA